MDNSNRPAPIIPHVHTDPAAGNGQFINQHFFNVQLNTISAQR